MNGIVTWLKHEFFNIIPAVIFFIISFQLIALTGSLMKGEYGITLTTFINALVAALVVAKVVLVADMLPFVNQFPHKPLLYNVVWKTAIYMTAAFLVHYLEKLLPFIMEYKDLALANSHLLEQVVWPHFWAIQIWLLVLFFMFSAIREFVRVLGAEKVRSMFLGPIKPNSEQESK